MRHYRWLLAICFTLLTISNSAQAETTRHTQLYAALETGILILTTEPCDLHSGQPSLFEFAAYATVSGEDDKIGCWFAGDGTVNMIFPDQPGVHSWAAWLFTPEVPQHE